MPRRAPTLSPHSTLLHPRCPHQPHSTPPARHVLTRIPPRPGAHARARLLAPIRISVAPLHARPLARRCRLRPRRRDGRRRAVRVKPYTAVQRRCVLARSRVSAQYTGAGRSRQSPVNPTSLERRGRRCPFTPRVIVLLCGSLHGVPPRASTTLPNPLRGTRARPRGRARRAGPAGRARRAKRKTHQTAAGRTGCRAAQGQASGYMQYMPIGN